MRRRSRQPPSKTDVFINCPFDSDYKPFFHAIIFTVLYCGFYPRCALEVDDSAEFRLEKIRAIISDCGFGIHDISRTELDASTRLPRFNMPLELGIFLGAHYYGNGTTSRKICLILDRSPHRYRKFISDISGQDIRAHERKIPFLVRHVRNWLRTHTHDYILAGDRAVYRSYRKFRRELPGICRNLGIEADRVEYADFFDIVFTWIFRDLFAQPEPASRDRRRSGR